MDTTAIKPAHDSHELANRGITPDQQNGRLQSRRMKQDQILNHQYADELDPGYSPMLAFLEASRCVQCLDAPCSRDCPADTDPGTFIRQIRFNNIKGAIRTIRASNIMGGVCARVCPYERLCESACSRTGIDSPINIGRLQRYAMDFERQKKLFVLDPVKLDKEKVAVIGAGPSGLAVASRLARMGYKVTVFEEREKAGGWATYGIPPSRLPQEVVDWEIEVVKHLGVEFKFNTKVGKDITLDQLKNQGYEAFYIGTGLFAPMTMDIPGTDLEGVTNGVEFLSKAKPTEGKGIKVGKNVVIIGGGDVAMDCASTAKMLGADNVTMVYRRSIKEMPASAAEKGIVQTMGVAIIPNLQPKEIFGKGKVEGVRCVEVNWIDRNKSEEIPNSETEIRADMVIFAIGQKAEDLKAIHPNLQLGAKGIINTNHDTGATNVEGIFAGGDVVNGGKTVVEAVGEGKQVAHGINEYLSKKHGRSVVGDVH